MDVNSISPQLWGQVARYVLELSPGFRELKVAAARLVWAFREHHCQQQLNPQHHENSFVVWRNIDTKIKSRTVARVVIIINNANVRSEQDLKAVNQTLKHVINLLYNKGISKSKLYRRMDEVYCAIENCLHDLRKAKWIHTHCMPCQRPLEFLEQRDDIALGESDKIALTKNLFGNAKKFKVAPKDTTTKKTRTVPIKRKTFFVRPRHPIYKNPKINR